MILCKQKIKKVIALALFMQLLILLPLVGSAGQTAQVKAGTLKLRSRKSQDAIVMVELKKGDRLQVLEEGNPWCKVSYEEFTGYVMREYITISGSSNSNGDSKKNDGALRLGDRGTDVQTLQRKLKEKGYLFSDADGVFGNATLDAVKSFQKKNGLTVDGVAGSGTMKALSSSNIASSNNSSNEKQTNYNSISQIGSTPGTSKLGDNGTNVKKLQQALEIKGFYTGKIDGSFGSGTEEAVKAFQRKHEMTPDGVAGTGTITILFGEKPSDTSSTTGHKDTQKNSDKNMDKPEEKNTSGINSILEIGSTPGTSKSGDKGTNVKKLQQALTVKGYYTGKIDSSFGSGTEKAVKAFQRDKGMSQDGVAGTGTITLLFGEKPSDTSSTTGKNSGSDSKGYATETLDWFNGGNRTIPKGATFTIKDVATGKTFQAKRWSGGSHMDVETVSSADTQKMLDIYGGSWSWRRRAILVQYNGHVYAGSMNGMGHGEKTVSGNDLDGHFCIHFEGSKTHGTDKVDAEHQNMVDKALKSTW